MNRLDELNEMIENDNMLPNALDMTLLQKRVKRKVLKHHIYIGTRNVFALVLVTVLMFGVGINTSPIFASKADDVPVVKNFVDALKLPAANNLVFVQNETVQENPEHLYKLNGVISRDWSDDVINVKFPEIVKKYGGTPDETRNLFFETWKYGIRKNVLYKDYRLEDIWNVKYATSSLYVDMNCMSQIFKYNPQEVSRITGEEIDYNYVWMPGDDGEQPVNSYFIGGDIIDGIAYRLDGEDVLLTEEVEYVEKHLASDANLNLISKTDYSYHVTKVDIFKYGNNYCFDFSVQLYYKGIKIDKASMGVLNSDDVNLLQLNEIYDRCTMLTKDTINGIYIFNPINETQREVKEITQLVDYQTAVEILSHKLNRKNLYTVRDAELVYCYGSSNEEIYTVEPYWQFEIYNDQNGKFFALINVQTGEMIER